MKLADWHLRRRLASIERSFVQRGIETKLVPHYVTTFGGFNDQWLPDTIYEFTVTPTHDHPWIWLGNAHSRTASGVGTGFHLRPQHNKYIRIKLERSGRYLGAGLAEVPAPAAAVDFGSGWMELHSIFGRAGYPHLWFFPVICLANDSITLEFLNRGTSNGRTAFHTLIGYKILRVPV